MNGEIPFMDLTEGENGAKELVTGRHGVIGISCGDLPQGHPVKDTIALKSGLAKRSQVKRYNSNAFIR
ncbi:hypothetical protein ABD76_00365 [Paenibacillus dendritiformis]|uniref:hypothetical protein n=1 Tax=Paenibacillus dendritiformis TaxID=130049 RepID=UPI0018CD6846|nr:hypothetical protein [Paenibacillus dendritiformis]MBG9791069.1 hypothetical protein [Paenibacillus dendritiformis]